PGTAPSGALLDNHQGFGRVNLDRSFKRVVAAIEGPGLATGQNSTFTINVPTANKTLRIVMAYSDFPGDTLVNNLNLVANDPTGKGFVGNQAESGGGTLALDKTNNVKVIQVKNAKKRNWTINAIASNVPAGPQDFAVAVVLV
ncbi:MAG TPA: serine protease, partial [Casimicrobiaceae bacterium]